MIGRLLIICCFLPVLSSAQAPQGLSYQAIAWDKNNLPKANATITITCNIRSLKLDGEIEYTETQTAKTNELGYFTLMIGENRVEQFKKINWGVGPKFLEVIIDGIAAGTTQMLSVPYALYAENTNIKAGNGIAINGNTISNTGDPDNDATNEIQTLQLTGNSLELTKGGGSADLSKILPFNQFKTAPDLVETEPKLLIVDIPQARITVPSAGNYLVHGSAEFRVPDNVTNPVTQLKIAPSRGAIRDVDISNATGFFYLNGFYAFNLQAGDTISLKFIFVHLSSGEKGFVRNACLYVQKIN